MNYFNSLPLRLQLEELGHCRFMDASEFSRGVEALKGKKIVFKDKNGQYRMFINKDSLILEQQPFKPQGMELIYLRKHSEK